MERAKQRLEKQKQGLELEREKMRRAIIKRTKKKLRRKGLRKFELVDGSFRSWSASVAHLVESVELLQTLWVLKGGKLHRNW